MSCQFRVGVPTILCEEIVILGPVFLHNMFPFERFMGVLKKYVRNRARPEGSISMGHQTEDVTGFCVDFIPGLKKIGLPKSRYEGRLTGKRHAWRGLNNMQGRIFLVSSTLHSTNELYLGDPVCR